MCEGIICLPNTRKQGPLLSRLPARSFLTCASHGGAHHPSRRAIAPHSIHIMQRGHIIYCKRSAVFRMRWGESIPGRSAVSGLAGIWTGPQSVGKPRGARKRMHFFVQRIVSANGPLVAVEQTGADVREVVVEQSGGGFWRVRPEGRVRPVGCEACSLRCFGGNCGVTRVR